MKRPHEELGWRPTVESSSRPGERRSRTALASSKAMAQTPTCWPSGGTAVMEGAAQPPLGTLSHAKVPPSLKVVEVAIDAATRGRPTPPAAMEEAVA